MLSDFSPSGLTQLNLFDNQQSYRNSASLMRTIDSINRDKGSIWFAGQGIQPQAMPWKMKQQFLSPYWTTRLSDIPIAKC